MQTIATTIGDGALNMSGQMHVPRTHHARTTHAPRTHHARTTQ